jgi:SAM-dependent methyltransferase
MSDKVMGPTGAGGATAAAGVAADDIGAVVRGAAGSTPLSGATHARCSPSMASILACDLIGTADGAFRGGGAEALTRETGPVEGFDRATYGDGFADVYDEWYGSLGDVEATIACLDELGDSGPLLELGVGTGRLARPLATHGRRVTGVDASSPMLSRLCAGDVQPPMLTVVQADMAWLPFTADAFGLAFVAYNTLFNLPDLESQRHCFASVRHVLRDGGSFVVETFVPDEDDRARNGVETRSIAIDRVVLSASRLDPITQTIAGQHVEITERGVRLRPWFLHYLHPTQLDDLATETGFTLEQRWADWSKTPFTDDATTHVSVYRCVP